MPLIGCLVSSRTQFLPVSTTNLCDSRFRLLGIFWINVERHGRWLADSCWEDLRGCHPQLCPPHCLLEVIAYTAQVAAWSLGLFLSCLQHARLTERNQCQFTSILLVYSCFGACSVFLSARTVIYGRKRNYQPQMTTSFFFFSFSNSKHLGVLESPFCAPMVKRWYLYVFLPIPRLSALVLRNWTSSEENLWSRYCTRVFSVGVVLEGSSPKFSSLYVLVKRLT